MVETATKKRDEKLSLVNEEIVMQGYD